MRLASIAIVSSLIIACGGKVPAEEFNADSGPDTAATGGDTSTTPTDGTVSDSTPTPTDGPITSDAKPTPDTCKKFVGGICNDKTKACCEKSGLTWSADACNSGLDYYCNALVDEVALGRATYHPEYLDACVKGWEDSLAKCEVSGLESAKYQIPCAQLFNGLIKPGETCKGTRYAECESPPGFGSYCDKKAGATSGRCRAYGFVGKGEGCNFAGSTVRYCDTGLYCDITSPTSTCKAITPLGGMCAGADDYSCGYTAKCADGKCTALGAEGAMCSINEDCMSYECTMGKCTKGTNSVVSPFICNGGM
jgi:hypothetical protein